MHKLNKEEDKDWIRLKIFYGFSLEIEFQLGEKKRGAGSKFCGGIEMF